MKEKIIITGGLGFIGSRFAKLCIEKGHNVKIIDKMTYAANLDRLETNIGYFRKDICDVTESDIKGHDYIVNFAAETHVDNSIEDGKPFIRSNVEGVFNLLEQSRKTNIKKFIQISTDEVYGDIKHVLESTEEHAIKPSSYYSATKAAADMLVMSACRTYGLPYIITRTCNNYGPGQHEEKFIPKLEKCLQENKPIPVYMPGTQTREWIHVDDNCNAIYNLMISNKINDIYNIGSGERYNNLEVIDILAKGKDKMVELVTDRKGHDKRYALNSNKYKSEFGDPSSITFKEYYK
jgi:dTDP-glucose 4,6-dehydratase